MRPIGLVLMFVGGPGGLLDFYVRLGLCQGGEVGEQHRDKEFLLNGRARGAVERLQAERGLQLAVLSLDFPYADILEMPTFLKTSVPYHLFEYTISAFIPDHHLPEKIY